MRPAFISNMLYGQLRTVYDTFDIIRDFIYNVKTAEPVIQGVPYNLRPRKQVNYKV